MDGCGCECHSESALSQKQDPLREESFFHCLHTYLHPSSCTGEFLCLWDAFVLFISHPFPSTPTLLPHTIFIVVRVHSSAPEPRALQEQDTPLSFPISLFLNVSPKDLPRLSRFLLSSFLLFSFSQLSPCSLIASSSTAELGFTQQSYPTALPGASGA